MFGIATTPPESSQSRSEREKAGVILMLKPPYPVRCTGFLPSFTRPVRCTRNMETSVPSFERTDTCRTSKREGSTSASTPSQSSSAPVARSTRYTLGGTVYDEKP